MQVTLNQQAEELLRTALARHPGHSPAEILEQALAEHVERETAATPAKQKLTREEFHAWLDQFTAYSDKIPSMPGESFSREMIYQTTIRWRPSPTCSTAIPSFDWPNGTIRSTPL